MSYAEFRRETNMMYMPGATEIVSEAVIGMDTAQVAWVEQAAAATGHPEEGLLVYGLTIGGITLVAQYHQLTVGGLRAHTEEHIDIPRLPRADCSQRYLIGVLLDLDQKTSNILTHCDIMYSAPPEHIVTVGLGVMAAIMSYGGDTFTASPTPYQAGQGIVRIALPRTSSAAIPPLYQP